MNRQHEVNGVTFYGKLAEVAATISEEEWAYYRLADNISDQIAEYMTCVGVSKAELANRMGTSRAFVTKVLSGDANMTLKTFAKILFHLGAKSEVKVIDKRAQVTWFEAQLTGTSKTKPTPKSWYAHPSRTIIRRESSAACTDIASAA